LAVAFVQDVRSAARCVFQDLMWFSAWASSTIEVFVQRAGVALAQIGDDEAGIGSFLADFDASDDPLDAAPTLCAVEEFLETTKIGGISSIGRTAQLRPFPLSRRVSAGALVSHVYAVAVNVSSRGRLSGHAVAV